MSFPEYWISHRLRTNLKRQSYIYVFNLLFHAQRSHASPTRNDGPFLTSWTSTTHVPSENEALSQPQLLSSCVYVSAVKSPLFILTRMSFYCNSLVIGQAFIGPDSIPPMFLEPEIIAENLSNMLQARSVFPRESYCFISA